MSQAVLSALKLNLGYAKGLIDQVSVERVCEQPAPGMNHPMWVLGHLAVTQYANLGLLGQPRELPDGWEPLFGNSSKPGVDASAYPAWAAVVQAFFEVHEAAGKAYAQAGDDALRKPNTLFLTDVMPTMGDLTAFLLTGHVAIHLGQLSAWRRVAGIAPVRLP